MQKNGNKQSQIQLKGKPFCERAWQLRIDAEKGFGHIGRPPSDGERVLIDVQEKVFRNRRTVLEKNDGFTLKYNSVFAKILGDEGKDPFLGLGMKTADKSNYLYHIANCV